MKVPFVDLHRQYKNIQSEIDRAVSTVIEETTFIGGRFVNEFEVEFSKAYSVNHTISCGNGTDSLYIILKMLGVGSGDEVLTVANSWISSSETITQTGARVVFVDAHPEYYSIDETQLQKKLTPKTKAVVAVHLQGQVCEMDIITAFCKKNELYLIEDCAQSHFSEYKGKKVGLFGIAASFSFYPGKNLGAYGDAGCMITNDDALATKLCMYARHGALKKHQHQMEGVNSRMDSLQAAILLAKLPHIHQWNDQRIAHAARYQQGLSGIKQISLPKVRPHTKHTFHLYVIRAQQRDMLAEFLRLKGIETSVHYPTPLPFLPAYQYLHHVADDFPVASRLQYEILSLPMFPELTREEIDYTVACIQDFYSNNPA
ncbi:MAG: DegT/DnrJ/EryC1/StrS family aminotransferase [Bacteroidetes bacterium]|nr:DegT/DnrJ/EryC1/StrS family aminotransferase [Bacteroidota bacterium]MBS1539731.1 DegT/DnrJ/EryC1/StrS family aminotransferase [Bacteroidota bacterium]